MNLKLRFLLLPLSVILAVAVGGGIYWLLQSQGIIKGPELTKLLPWEDPTKDWNTYTNEKYDYTFKYPKDWRIAEDYMRFLMEEMQFTPFPQPGRRPGELNVDLDNYAVVTKTSPSYGASTIQDMREDKSGFTKLHFGLGETITINPTPNKLSYYLDYPPESWPYVKVISQEDFRLSSGKTIKRLLLDVRSDDGRFVYDLFLYPYNNGDFNFLEIKIDTLEKSYEKDIFELLVNTVVIK